MFATGVAKCVYALLEHIFHSVRDFGFSIRSTVCKLENLFFRVLHGLAACPPLHFLLCQRFPKGMPDIKTVAGEAASDDSNGGDDDETAVGDENEKHDEGDTMLDSALEPGGRGAGTDPPFVNIEGKQVCSPHLLHLIKLR